MLLWEIDRPLFELTQLYGFEKALRCYRASHYAARGLVSLVAQHEIVCQMRPRLSLYLAADDRPKLIKNEYELRNRVDLPSLALDHAKLFERFAIARAAALLSRDAADADPVQLTRGLLDTALGRGARLLKANAASYESSASAVHVGLESGLSIEAHHVVLATGYVRCRTSSGRRRNDRPPVGPSQPVPNRTISGRNRRSSGRRHRATTTVAQHLTAVLSSVARMTIRL